MSGIKVLKPKLIKFLEIPNVIKLKYRKETLYDINYIIDAKITDFNNNKNHILRKISILEDTKKALLPNNLQILPGGGLMSIALNPVPDLIEIYTVDGNNHTINTEHISHMKFI